jgi:uncharacterized membrane protein
MASVTKEVQVKAPVAKVYEFWRNFENFPRFMNNIESIQVTGEDESHWKMHGPLGKTIEWDAKTISVQENKKIAWQSTGGDIETHGAVTFEEIADGQTKVTVGLEYRPPAGAIGELVAKLTSNPEKQLEEDLNRFKNVAESADFGQATSGTPAVGEGSYVNTAETSQRKEGTVTGSGSGVDEHGETRSTKEVAQGSSHP